MHALLMTLLVIVALSLIVVVLLQSGKSAGLSGAISGGAEQLFGKQKARGLDLSTSTGYSCTCRFVYRIGNRHYESIIWNIK